MTLRSYVTVLREKSVVFLRSLNVPFRCSRCEAQIRTNSTPEHQSRLRGEEKLEPPKEDASSSSGFCKICSSPNDLLSAAEHSREAILIQREKRNARIMFIIVCTFLFCWTPAFVLYQSLSIWPELPIPPLVISSSWWLAYSNSACNPIIYTVFNNDFREAVIKFLCKC